MGATNVAKVFANWRHLSHRDVRALAFMANMALDADNPPVYFGGWEAVAEALGLDCDGRRASAKEVHRQTLASLVAAGAVVSSGQARLRVRAEYALALDPSVTFEPAGTGRNIKWTASPRQGRGNDSLPHVGQQNIAPTSNESLPHVGQRNVGRWGNESLPPRSTEEPQGGVLDEERGGITITQAFSLTNEREGKTGALDGNLPLEDERAKQMREMEAVIAKYEDPDSEQRRKLGERIAKYDQEQKRKAS